MYIVYIRERYFFLSSVYIKKAIENVEVNVGVQNGALGFRGNVDKRCVSSIQLTFTSMWSYGYSPQ